jgi:hypothetical protein
MNESVALIVEMRPTRMDGVLGVQMRVVYQDEEKIPRGSEQALEGLEIYSSYHPELYSDSLYVRGTESAKDNFISFCPHEDPEELIRFWGDRIRDLNVRLDRNPWIRLS